MNGIKIYVAKDSNNQNIIIDGDAIDLFEDENILFTLKQTDIRDIGTNFTDFSQDFTVPASPKNNINFKYWFDIFNDNQHSNFAGIPARIDIDGVFFKKGIIKILSFNIDENGDNKSYTIQFTSNLKALKDTFGDTQLSTLPWATIFGSDSINFTDYGVRESIISTTLNKDIEIPLISSNRKLPNFTTLKYTSGVVNTNGIKRGELRPSIKFRKIIEGIESKYSIKFSGGFIDDNKLDLMYLWLNKNDTPFSPGGVILEMNGSFSATPFLTYTGASTYDYFTCIRYNTPGSLPTQSYKIYLNTTMSDQTTPYMAKLQEVVLNSDGSVNEKLTIEQPNFGIVSQSEYSAGSHVAAVSYTWMFGNEPIGTKRNFRPICETKTSDTVTVISGEIKVQRFLGAFQFVTSNTATIGFSTSTLITNPVNISGNVPDLTIQDFITSLIKTYNLVIIPVGEFEFRLEYFNTYYGTGSNLDITKYTSSKRKINKIKTYKKLTFKHADSEYGNNILFKNNQLPIREYGEINESKQFGDVDEYKVETKFNLLMFRELNDIGFTSTTELNNTWLVSDSVGNDNSIVKNKPTIFYYNGKSNILENKYLAYTLDGNSTTMSLSSYSQFSNIDNLQNYTTTLCFSKEFMFSKGNYPNNLFSNGYQKLINGIYSLYAREYEIEANLPKQIYTKLSLNNLITIGNVRYSITDIQINLINGNTKLKLNNVIEIKEAIQQTTTTSEFQSQYLK